MDKVGHTVLQKGQVLRSPNGEKDWVVIDNGEDSVRLACVQKYMNKSSRELMDWFKKQIMILFTMKTNIGIHLT